MGNDHDWETESVLKNGSALAWEGSLEHPKQPMLGVAAAASGQGGEGFVVQTYCSGSSFDIVDVCSAMTGFSPVMFH